jgi:triacylglycerol lipase
MKRVLVGFAALFAAGISNASSQTYYQCTPTGCTAEGSVSAYSSSDATKYPIVMAHGLLGTGKYFGVLDYWYNIPQAMAANGAKVYVTMVSANNSTALRGEQLLAQVQDIIAITGKPKVNIIGHSHGGPTARYVAGVAPQLVASVTSVAGPTMGTPVADVVKGVSTAVGPLGSVVIASIVNAFASLFDPSQPQDSLAALADIDTAGALAFNKQFPGGVPTTSCGSGAASYQGVNYYSWSGDSSMTGNITTGIDPTDALTAVTGLAFLGKANDGLIGSCASHLGVVIRDNYYQNHFDEVNQTAGLVSFFTTSPPSLYVSQANRLKNAGL